MGYNPFSPLAPAQLNVLCIPAGPVTSATLQQCIQWLQRTAAIVIESDDDSPQHDATALTNRRAKTALFLLYNTTVDAGFLTRVNQFEPNRNTQLVLGIIDLSAASHESSVSDEHTLIQSAKSELSENTAKQYGHHIPDLLLAVNGSPDNVVEGTVVIADLSGDTIPTRLSTCLFDSANSWADHASQSLESVVIDLPQPAKDSERQSISETQKEPKVEDGRRQSVLTSLTRSPPPTPPTVDNEELEASSGKTIASALIKLQTGHWSEALNLFAEGARVARDSNILGWHAKALEGILVCLLLLAWAGKEFQIPQNCYPTHRGYSSSSAVHSIAESNRTVSERFSNSSIDVLQALTAMLPGFLATILNLYDRATKGMDNSLPQLLLLEVRIRLSALLSTIKTHRSVLDLATLEDIVGPRKKFAGSQAFEPATTPLVLRASALSSLLIESITEAQANLSLPAACPIYLAACAQLAKLELGRKHGFYLKSFLQQLPQILLEARKAGAAEAIAHRGLALPPEYSLEHDNTARSIRSLVSKILELYDMPNIATLSTRSSLPTIDLVEIKQRLSHWLSVFLSGDVATKLETLRACVRVSDALPDLLGSIQCMTLLLFIARQTVVLAPISSNTVPLLGIEEQQRLMKGIETAVQASQRHGNMAVLARYWDDFIVRDISLQETATAGRLMPHTPQDLSQTTTSGTSKRDPFIYNPFSSDSRVKGHSIIVKDELVTFDVVLQNPLEVEIEVENISILSEGCDFQSHAHSVVVGPLCTQTFTLQGRPTTVGLLTISGCRMKIKNCFVQDFWIFNGTWKPPIITKRVSSGQNIEVSLPELKKLEMKVVDPLPQLQIRSSSLVQPSVMLLDGERCRFSITLENTGDIPADLVLFGYQDSVSRQIQDALATKDLQPPDTYELQYQLSHCPTIKRVQNVSSKKSVKAVAIAAHSKQTFDFTILGKAGLTEASVLIDYAYIGRPRHEVDSTFYTRQLKYAVNVTVNGSVDIHRCAVLSIPESAPENPVVPVEDADNQTINIQDAQKLTQTEHGQCLLQLDLRSFWQSPISVTIETADQTTDDLVWSKATTATVLPAQYNRALLLIPRIYIENPHDTIPSLAQKNRQFVVSASKLSLEAELASREIFWYREQVCKKLRIKWVEEYGDSKRHGVIDVRKGIRLSPRMIDALRVEHVQISFDMVPPAGPSPNTDTENNQLDTIKRGHNGFEIPKSTFTKLVLKIQNSTQEDLKLLLRIQPSLHDQPHNLAMDLSKKFVWSGVLQKVLPTTIKPGESAESSLDILGLACGTYEVNATVEEIRSRSRAIAGIQDRPSERRIWHARAPALIHVVDPS